MRKPFGMASTTENFSESHLDRKSLKRPDSFTIAATSFFVDVFQNTRVLMGVGGGLLLAAAGFSVWTNQVDTASRQATGAWYEAEKALDQEMKSFSSSTGSSGVGTGGKTPLTASREGQDFKSNYIKIDVDAQFSKGVTKLREVTEKFPKTRASFEAQMQLGSLYFDHGQFEKALEWYQKAASTAGDKLDRGTALSSVGYAQENLGKPTEALASFQKAIAVGETSLKGDLLLAIARCYEGLHDSAKARSIYEQVSKEFTGGDYSKVAEIRKSRL